MQETKGQLVINKITTAQASSMTLTDKQLWLSPDTAVYSVNNTQPDANGNVSLSIPTVNNATLTIQRNGTTVNTFTANSSSNVTANITVPTNTSQLTNGAGFITSSALSGYATETWVGQQGYITGITSSDVTTALGFTPYNSTNPAGYITSLALSGYATEQWVENKGYITGITSSDITTALGYTPYNATNPSGYITSSALTGYATQTWVGQQGYITGITSSDVTTALGFTPYNSTNPSGYQANIIETIKVNGTELTPSSKAVDISVPTNNNQLTNGAGYITSSALSGYATQSWVGQQGFLTSSDLSNYARLDTAQTFTSNQAFTGGLYRKAVWAVGTAPSSTQYNNIQMQDSTGNQWGSFGLRYNTDGSLELRQNIRFLDGTNNWAFFSLISKSGNATEIRGKADVVTFESDNSTRIHFQDNSITKGTNPSTNKYNQIVFDDGSNSSEWQNSRLGIIQHIVDTSGTTKLQLAANRFYSGSATAATIETSITKNGVASCSFPNTTCVDGSFTSKAASICSGVALNGSGGYNYTLTDLPNDGQKYMVLIHATATTGSTSGNNALIQVTSSEVGTVNIVRAYTRTSSTMQASASAWIPIGSNRTLHLNQSSAWNGTAQIDMRGYRRIGTNS